MPSVLSSAAALLDGFLSILLERSPVPTQVFYSISWDFHITTVHIATLMT